MPEAVMERVPTRGVAEFFSQLAPLMAVLTTTIGLIVGIAGFYAAQEARNAAADTRIQLRAPLLDATVTDVRQLRERLPVVETKVDRVQKDVTDLQLDVKSLLRRP